MEQILLPSIVISVYVAFTSKTFMNGRKIMLKRFEDKIGSQNGEAGILDYLFSVIEPETRTFVEFGYGGEFNCYNLLQNHGWGGLLIDSNPVNYYLSEAMFGTRTDVKRVIAEITPENIDDIITENLDSDVDLLSIDIDGLDYHVWKQITSINPQVVVIEYNASMGDSRSITIPNIPHFNRHNFNGAYHGASLAALTKLAKTKGMKLVGCDSMGVNAFFVSEDADFPEVKVKDAYVDSQYRRYWREVIEIILKFGVIEV